MKKKVAAMIAILMVLLMGTTVFAAPSVDKDSANDEILKAEVGAISDVTAETPDGTAVAVSITAVGSIDIVESAKKSADAAAAKIAEGAVANVIGIVDVQSGIPEGYISIDVTFKVAGVKVGDKVLVLHQKDDGTWETLASKITKDGEVTATFTSFSPVAIVKIETGTPAGANAENNSQATGVQGTNAGETANQGTEVKSTDTAQSSTSTGLTSPTTGDFIIPMVIVVVLLCGTGIVLLGRKVISR